MNFINIFRIVENEIDRLPNGPRIIRYWLDIRTGNYVSVEQPVSSIPYPFQTRLQYAGLTFFFNTEQEAIVAGELWRDRVENCRY